MYHPDRRWRAARLSGRVSIISHSARDEALVDKFHDLFQTGLGIHGADTVFISSVPGRAVDIGNVHDTSPSSWSTRSW